MFLETTRLSLSATLTNCNGQCRAHTPGEKSIKVKLELSQNNVMCKGGGGLSDYIALDSINVTIAVPLIVTEIHTQSTPFM